MEKKTDLKTDLMALYLKSLGKMPRLARNEEMNLAKRKDRGDRQAFQRLVRGNLKLVIGVAKKFTNYGLDVLDLIQEGNLGLIMAVEKFDYTRDIKLSTCAVWWIRHAITKALTNKSRTIRIPIHIRDALSKLKKFKRRFIEKTGREPLLEEIIKKSKLSKRTVKNALTLTEPVISLNEKIGRNKDIELLNFVEDKSSNGDPYKTVEKKMNREFFDKIMRKNLSKKEAIVLNAWLYDRKTLKETAEMPCLPFSSKEMARQIKKRAIKKMRHFFMLSEIKKDDSPFLN